ncbi:MAG: peptide chain release factor-like protein [bacterium]
MIFFPVSPEKQRDLEERMERLGIRDEDLEEHFVRSSGKGGQKVNKTSTCVSLHHKPTGVMVKCQQTRSQALNRFYARRRLVEHLEGRRQEVRAEEQRERDRIRRAKQRRTRRAREKLREQKEQQAEKKRQRRGLAWSTDGY